MAMDGPTCIMNRSTPKTIFYPESAFLHFVSHHRVLENRDQRGSLRRRGSQARVVNGLAHKEVEVGKVGEMFVALLRIGKGLVALPSQFPQVVMDLKTKVNASRSLFISHIEDMQNVVHLHKTCSNAGLEEISTLAASDVQSVREFLAAYAAELNSIFDDLHGTLSIQQEEIALFARELCQRFDVSIEHTTNISKFIHGFLDKFIEESKELESHAFHVDEVQTKSITEFQKAYEEQSKSDAEKLIADLTTLVFNHICCQKELVDAKLFSLRETIIGNKTFLDGRVSSIEGIMTDAKRKWQEFSIQAGNDAKDSADFSAAKHCRMELLLQECVNTTEKAFKHWKKTRECVNEMGSQHASKWNVSDSNEQHDTEIASARAAAEDDVAKPVKT